ncbi:MAG TPA: helicase C-terminal domain-containing protein [Candidatus Limnocylindria bacterium]|nr:helicase C-terminal domain-containing protein [Candidatus Limnocylindria bacterium]
MILPAEASIDAGQPTLPQRVAAMFSSTGVFSKAKNFEYRPQQQQMAVAVADALCSGGNLLVEAGTGVGKSFGYLVPAILFALEKKKKAIISTHTINLQEQLVEKDLPVLKKVIPQSFEFAMLKGRGNYLCTRRLQKALQQSDNLFTSPESAELQRILEWSHNTQDGSLSDFEHEPDPKVWEHVCSERGLCTPKKCGHSSDFAKEGGMPCFFQRARQRIISADVLVLNHTLLFTLLGGMEEEIEGGVLFKNDFVIFDEAHTVEQVAARHIGVSVSNGAIRYALQRLWNPNSKKGLLATLRKGNCVPLVDQLLSQTGQFFEKVEDACETVAESSRPKFETPRRTESSEGDDPRRRQWSEVRIREADIVEDTITLPIQRLREGIHELIQMTDDKETGDELMECNRRLGDLRESVRTFLSHDADEHVYWVERSGKTNRTLSLNAAPVDVAAYLEARLFGAGTSIIMTSATLAIKSGRTEVRDADSGEPDAPTSIVTVRAADSSALRYFANRVGGGEAQSIQLGSPYDFERQMKVYVVPKMPDPKDAAYEDALVKWIKHFVKETHGSAFVLFTNSRLMQQVASRLEPFLEALGIESFVQGTGLPRSTMLQKFKENVGSVLFGTDSFWQGVDVPGDALRNVIITRLPFAVPDHPLIEAKIERIEVNGGNAFTDFTLPEAILKFRQGVGRLIRTNTDSGIVAILDNRIVSKRYGKAFLEAIPPCPVEFV